jgi:hypothetical protein
MITVMGVPVLDPGVFDRTLLETGGPVLVLFGDG